LLCFAVELSAAPGLGKNRYHKEPVMENWIPFQEGTYAVEQAYLVAPDHSAVMLERPTIEIYSGRSGRRLLKGTGLIQNLLLVELLEISDDIDILLDLGERFKYRMKSPHIQAGKVFAPDVRSSLQFSPSEPWQPIEENTFDELQSKLNLI
jgi:hypothetical protein